jgi:hypothetical protein
MIPTGEIRKGGSQIQFSFTVLEATPLRGKTGAVSADLARLDTPNRLNISGSQLLAGASVLCAVGVLMWAILRLWLFES